MIQTYPPSPLNHLFRILSANLGIVYSTNYGQSSSWTLVSGTSSYARGLSMDSTGQFVVACSPSGLFRSTNYGASWSQAVSVSSSTSCWCNSDSTGSKITLSINNGASGYVMVSPNSGSSWATTFGSVAYPYSVASSSDGSIILLTTSPGLIYASSDSGASFTSINTLSDSWSSVAVSASGEDFSPVLIKCIS